MIERASILAVDGIIKAEHITALRAGSFCEAGLPESWRQTTVTPKVPEGKTVANSIPADSGIENLDPLEKAMADHIRKALAASSGKIYGLDGTAARLGLKPSTLQSRMKKLGIGKGG